MAARWHRREPPAIAAPDSGDPPGHRGRPADAPWSCSPWALYPVAGLGEDPADLAPYRAALREIGQRAARCWWPRSAARWSGVCQLIVFRHLQARGGLCAEIESVHVHPDQRGRASGGCLIGDAIERARALGCYRVQLTSNLARPEAHRFYQRLGFVPSHVGFKLPLVRAPMATGACVIRYVIM